MYANANGQTKEEEPEHLARSFPDVAIILDARHTTILGHGPRPRSAFENNGSGFHLPGGEEPGEPPSDVAESEPEARPTAGKQSTRARKSTADCTRCTRVSWRIDPRLATEAKTRAVARPMLREDFDWAVRQASMQPGLAVWRHRCGLFSEDSEEATWARAAHAAAAMCGRVWPHRGVSAKAAQIWQTKRQEKFSRCAVGVLECSTVAGQE